MCVCVCVFQHSKFVSMVSYKLLVKIHHIYNFSAVGDKDEPIRS